MVFFSCEGCNETLKKAQVENHIRRCGCPVSCVDCSQVFPGVSYQQVRGVNVCGGCCLLTSIDRSVGRSID